MKALALAIGLLGLSAASLPAHAFQAQAPSTIVAPQNDVTSVQYYRDYDRGYRRHRHGYRGYDRGYDRGYRGGYAGPRRGPDAVIVTPNRPGVYRGNGFTVRQY
ncbi:hypothetical protein [Bradyrhizobium prioriisuperbiae]|uniref:hypothetical protein n=1 Tax=Bradyrhizobium prioriisuperbiae TaxID=2854389 RepID=UPI0028E3B126|nr:hypothetical protein [Bradyrhizobium prioritasuperba]